MTNTPPKTAAIGAEPDDGDAWVVAAGSELKIRLRSLTNYLQRGGALNHVHLVEAVDGTWTMFFRLKNRPGEYRLNHFQSERPKTYKDVALAIACCRRDLGYTGAITLLTEKFPGAPNGDAPRAGAAKANSVHQ